jgi:hypothetical protein
MLAFDLCLARTPPTQTGDHEDKEEEEEEGKIAGR